MNYLEKLLQGAPVEWKTLREVAKLQRGRVISKQYLSENIGDYPVYSSQTANNGEIGTISTFDFDQEAITWTTDGANAGTVFHRLGKFSITNVCGLVNILDLQQLDYKFLFYWLSVEAKKYVYSGMGNPKLMSNQMEKIKIPIPPLSVQKEIARILDAFAAITSELTSELTLRQKQYQHYRDKLLTFGDEVQWKPLGEVADVIDSLHKTPVYADKGLSMCRVTDIKGGFLNLEETFKVSEEVFAEFTKRYTPKKYDLVMSRVGSYGNVSIVPLDDAVCMGQNTVVIHSHINSKFMYYFLTSKSAQEFIEKNVGGGNQKTLSLKTINLIPIPLPPIEEQKRIAAILDKFHTLTHSLSEGLPKEIELRQKQYEYYRDLLLNFKR
ncbi:restriction endonuclease subunit S [Avibacterium avium]|uniref:restriction endonuclease subunit S n=1 Tax=Avibacterium avium TaxID=751 RepID=UPI003BF88169